MPTKKTTVKKIKKKNKQFELSDLTAKRVMIAKDVLIQLQTGRLFATDGVYLGSAARSVIYSALQDVSKLNLQTLFATTPSCNVCALGACFVSSIRLFNKVDIKDPNFGTRKDLVNSCLNRYFTIDQLKMIENTFEGVAISGEDTDSDMVNCAFTHDRYRIVYRKVVGDDYDSSRETRFVLESIMQNIIDNNGTFVPKTAPVAYKTFWYDFIEGSEARDSWVKSKV